MGPGGFEPTPLSSGKTHISAQRGAQTGARSPDDTPDADLRQVIDAWPTLPAAVRADILDRARAGRGDPAQT